MYRTLNAIKFAATLTTMQEAQLRGYLEELAKYRLDDESIEVDAWLASFIQLLIRRYFELRIRLDIQDDFLEQLDAMLKVESVRAEVTTRAFSHGSPTFYHLQSVVDALVQAAWWQHKLLKPACATAQAG
ncbi:MAG: hypothetical protein SGI77_21405 [Pirellulaceae bacterium]|nr:hypothetical protein [Pirellulaceae bacterium]